MGETAPGPLDLRLPPSAAVLAGTPYFRLVAHGLTPRQARTIRQLARRVDRIEQAAEGGAGCLAQTLGAVPGIGPWTVQFMLGSAMGEPDAVLEGDYNLPHTVSWALAGEPRGSDARMLELLESYRGHRYRVTRLLWISGARAPRSGSRRALRGRVSAPGAHAKKR